MALFIQTNATILVHSFLLGILLIYFYSIDISHISVSLNILFSILLSNWPQITHPFLLEMSTGRAEKIRPGVERAERGLKNFKKYKANWWKNKRKNRNFFLSSRLASPPAPPYFKKFFEFWYRAPNFSLKFGNFFSFLKKMKFWSHR